MINKQPKELQIPNCILHFLAAFILMLQLVYYLYKLSLCENSLNAAENKM